MKLDVSFYDIRIKNLFRYTLQLLSVHGEYINLYCAKKRKIISILLSDKMFYDIAPYRMIINKIKYPAINFLDIYKVGTFTAEKINFITTKGKCLECIILNAEKFTPKEYLPTIHNKYSLNNFLYTLRYLQMYKSPVKLLPEVEKMISKTIEALRNENTGVLDMCITNGIGLGMG
ncbi:MAG: hypothetical protein N2Z73_00195, partial [Endomicrobia bacterium]|nr:hypothetical protein [Endomicrobiia bacterium]